MKFSSVLFVFVFGLLALASALNYKHPLTEEELKHPPAFKIDDNDPWMNWIKGEERLYEENYKIITIKRS